MRSLSLLLVACLVLPFQPVASAQNPAPMLNLIIVEGEGAINNVRQRTAREPIVQVEDENHRPVAGAVVLFTLPDRGAGGTFADGSHTFRTTTNAQGRATARGIRLNNTQGQFQIAVTATHNGLTATTTITQSIAAGAATAGAAGAGVSGKLIAIVAVAAAAAAGGAYAATRIGNNTPAAGGAPATTITAGAGTVGPPR